MGLHLHLGLTASGPPCVLPTPLTPSPPGCILETLKIPVPSPPGQDQGAARQMPWSPSFNPSPVLLL